MGYCWKELYTLASNFYRPFYISVFHENIKINIHLISINASKNMSVVFNKLFDILISSVLINP